MFTSLFLSLLLYASSPTFSHAQHHQTPTIIEIKDGLGNGPRSSASIPIRGMLLGGTIYLSFSSNLGEVEVSVSEAAEGLIMSTVVDSSTLSAILPFSGSPGEYSITFSLSSGDEYDGSFVIE